MKLLIYTHEFPPQTGGAGRYSYGIAKGLGNLDQEVTVLTRSYSKDNTLSDNKEKFQIIRKPKRGLTLFLIYYLLKYKPDHLLVTQSTAQQEASTASIFSSFKYSIIVHGSEVLRYPQGSQPYRRLWEKAASIMAVSEYTRKLLIDLGKVPPDKISVVHGGVDTETFSNESNVNALKARLGITDQKVILTLARLDSRKGQDMVIKSLPQIIKSIPNIKYIIAGTGENLKGLKDLVNEYQLNKYVIFAGSVAENELIDYYDLCDVFVMPSRQEGKTVEGLGLSFLEANARGKPVIGGNHGGVPEAIISGETGLLVDPYDTNDIANAIIKLLKDKELAIRLGKQGRERCFSSFSWNHTARKILENISK